MEKSTERCRGCRNDFYNGKQNFSTFGCWSLKDARGGTRYRIHRDTVPTQPRAFTKVEVFACFYNPPMFYYDSLPDFVKAGDVVEPASCAS
jgi:hypothetical protein